MSHQEKSAAASAHVSPPESNDKIHKLVGLACK
jgi:hypothetical protein